MKTEAKLTIITSQNPAVLGKRYEMTKDGISKKTAGQMLQGVFRVHSFTDASSLAALLGQIGTDQALIASLPTVGELEGSIVTKAKKSSTPGAIARTKNDFQFPVGQPGVIVFDYDPIGHAKTREQLWEFLQSVGVGNCGAVWWCSGSSFIYHGDIEINGLRGQRIYLTVMDVADTVRVGEVLGKRFWLDGLGRVEISASGQRLTRSVFDAAMFEPARLDFIGGAVCESPLSQRRGLPEVLCDGGYLC